MLEKSPEQVLAIWESVTRARLDWNRRTAFVEKVHLHRVLREASMPELLESGQELFARDGVLLVQDWATMVAASRPQQERGRPSRRQRENEYRSSSVVPLENSIQKRIPSGSGRPSQSKEPVPLNRDSRRSGSRAVTRWRDGAPVYPGKADGDLHKGFGNINDHDG